MSRKTQSLKSMCRSLLGWRNDINKYIEGLDSQPTDSEEKAITYAAVAIVGLLVFAGIVIGSIWLTRE